MGHAGRLEAYRGACAEYGIPSPARDALAEYLTCGQPVGPFLTAVLANDLVGAACRADDTNVTALANYARFLANIAPHASWGSLEKVRGWIDVGGETGRAATPKMRVVR